MSRAIRQFESHVAAVVAALTFFTCWNPAVAKTVDEGITLVSVDADG